MKPACKNCKWAKVAYKSDGTVRYMQCCRYAPRPVEGITDDWPYLTILGYEDGSNFCGEFEKLEVTE